MGDVQPVPPGAIAFGVFGDGPYRPWENGRYRRLIADVNRHDLKWFVHVGDIIWYPCSDAMYRKRLQSFNSIQHPVIYTPGDNEWTDCHSSVTGSYDPLDRLAKLREVFFADPELSLGQRVMQVRSQAAVEQFSEFVENAAWEYGGFHFATVHVVGSSNGSYSFRGRTALHDSAVARRTAAALDWIDRAFAAAADGKGVVIMLHAYMGLERDESDMEAYEAIVDRLEDRARAYAGMVLLIHGDDHELLLDQPLHNRVTGELVGNFTRLETFGSPDIGWVRVVLDTVRGTLLEIEPRKARGWPF